MKKILFLILITTTFLVAQMEQYEEESAAVADCLILKDENSIICKYSLERSSDDKEVTFTWINPNGEISRERKMEIPAGHGSIYDYRYISGRIKGTLMFKVTDGEEVYSTTFELQ